MMRRKLSTGIASVLLVVATATTGGAAVTPTEITSISATASASGGSISVSGAATFGGQGVVVVGSDPANDNVGGAGTAGLGIDLTGVGISQPTSSTPNLVFTIQLNGMVTSLPETATYELNFAVASAGLPTPTFPRYEITAWRTNAQASVGANPYAELLTGTQSGNTTQSLAPPEFDQANSEIRVAVPMALIGAAPGSEIRPHSFSDRLQIQCCRTFSAILDSASWSPYTIPQRTVMLGKATPGTSEGSVQFTTNASVAADGSFTGALGATPAGEYDVWARACFGANCKAKSTRVAVT